MGLYETQPQTISRVLLNSWKLYKLSFKNVWFWSLIVSVVSSIHRMMGYVGIYVLDSENKFYFSWEALVSLAIALFIGSFFVPLILSQINMIATLNESDLKTSIYIVIKKFFPIYAAIIIYNILFFLGVYLYLLPAIFIWILFVMFVPLILFDNVSFVQAFIRSAKMVWGNWWQTFFVFLVPMCLLYLLRDSLHFILKDSIFFAVFDLVILTFVTPYLYSVMLIQFNNLKMKMKFSSLSKNKNPL